MNKLFLHEEEIGSSSFPQTAKSSDLILLWEISLSPFSFLSQKEDFSWNLKSSLLNLFSCNTFYFSGHEFNRKAACSLSAFFAKKPYPVRLSSTAVSTQGKRIFSYSSLRKVDVHTYHIGLFSFLRAERIIQEIPKTFCHFHHLSMLFSLIIINPL